MLRKKTLTETSTTSWLLSLLPAEKNTQLPELVLENNEQTTSTAQSMWTMLSQTAGWLNPFKGKNAHAATARLATVYAALSSIMPVVAASASEEKCFTLPLTGTSAPCDFYELSCDVSGLAERVYQTLATQCGAYQINTSISTPFGKIEQICLGNISAMDRDYLNVTCQPIVGYLTIPPHVESFGHSHYGYSICDLSYLFANASACVVDVMNNMTRGKFHTSADDHHEAVLLKYTCIVAGFLVSTAVVGASTFLLVNHFRPKAVEQDAADDEAQLNQRAPEGKTGYQRV